MYTSGQFAMMGSVGRKALRVYREEGLLIPARTNEENGYHYYDESQLSTLETIKRLRSIGLSLYEIRQILDGAADEKDIVAGKIRETDDLLKDMKEMISGKAEETEDVVITEPDIRPFKRCTCLFIDENVELERLGISVGRLYENAAREKVDPSGSHFVRYDGMEEGEGFSMRTYLPVSGALRGVTEEVFEERCLHLNFKGGFSRVRDGHGVLFKYAEEKGIGLSGRAYEVYNKDMSVDIYYCIIDSVI
ncbi:MAG: MerR family transcriptional regulator [Clostridiales bacterium]|nr:MerR family transcriptional regulator [Clostridiales bacterium]